MIESKRECSLQVVVDSVLIEGMLVRDIQLSDLRLSISLDGLPIVHVTPFPGGEESTEIDHDESQNFVVFPFRGAGKSCTFHMNKRFAESGKIVFLLVKHVDSLNDHLILAMTSPIIFRELALSLPSSSHDHEPPFVSRKFEFLDHIGVCELRIRLLHASRKTIRTAARPITRSRPANVPLIARVKPHESVTPEVKDPPKAEVERSEALRMPSYGKMKNRNPVINLMNLK